MNDYSNNLTLVGGVYVDTCIRTNTTFMTCTKESSYGGAVHCTDSFFTFHTLCIHHLFPLLRYPSYITHTRIVSFLQSFLHHLLSWRHDGFIHSAPKHSPFDSFSFTLSDIRQTTSLMCGCPIRRIPSLCPSHLSLYSPEPLGTVQYCIGSADTSCSTIDQQCE